MFGWIKDSAVYEASLIGSSSWDEESSSYKVQLPAGVLQEAARVMDKGYLFYVHGTIEAEGAESEFYLRANKMEANRILFAEGSSLTEGLLTISYFDLTHVETEVADLMNDVTDLKTALDEYVIDKFATVEPNDWFDPNSVTNGVLHKNGTAETVANRYYTDYIKVNPNDIIRAYYKNTMAQIAMLNVACYDKSKNVLVDKGTDSQVTNFTIPSGVYYVRITLSTYYTSEPWITINFTPTSITERVAYFAPYEVLTTDFLTPESENKLNSIPNSIGLTTVKGTNYVPVSDDGVGAYVVQSGIPKHFPSYTNYHYVVVPLKPNTRYFVNYPCSWWILTDNADRVISNGTTPNPTTKRFIDSGNASKLYYTVSQSNWNNGLIISEGVSGTSYNIQKEGIFNGINQLMFDTWYACALPKNTIRLTNGISEKFYYRNILSLPDKNHVSVKVSGMETIDENGVTITPNISTNFNNYLFMVFDDNLSIVENNNNGQFGQARADNLQDCSVLLLGDSTIAQGKIGEYLIDGFSARSKTVTLLGALGSGNNKNEGRAGWSASQYLTNNTYEGIVNPFYNPQTETFDFSYYMANQSYSNVDFVVIQLGINDLYNVGMGDAKDRIDKLCNDMFTIISSIKTFNPDQKIILNLPTPCTTDITKIDNVTQRLIMAKFVFYNAMMMVLSTNFSNTRCSNCHLILDGATDIFDTIHPNNNGYNKMALEVLSQINVFQNN